MIHAWSRLLSALNNAGVTVAGFRSLHRHITHYPSRQFSISVNAFHEKAGRSQVDFVLASRNIV